MNCLYIALAFFLIWLAGKIAERVNYNAMKRAQDRYNQMQRDYRVYLDKHYRKGK